MARELVITAKFDDALEASLAQLVALARETFGTKNQNAHRPHITFAAYRGAATFAAYRGAADSEFAASLAEFCAGRPALPIAFQTFAC